MAKEVPILFSGPEVRAIIASKKQVTRRGAKPRKYPSLLEPGKWSDSYILDPGNREWLHRDAPCAPGDRLWVRETWALESQGPDEYDRLVFQADRAACHSDRWNRSPMFFMESDYQPAKWSPSIFMPRWASRLTLQVVSARLERLHNITEEDAAAEGVGTDCPVGSIPRYLEGPHVYCFASLWDSLNAKRGFGWDVNPLVWRIEFDGGAP